MNAQSKPGPVDFDLSRGRVDRRATPDDKGAHDEQVVLVSVAALVGLEKIAGLEITRKFARSIGVSFGRRVAAKLGSAEAVEKASIEAFVSAMATEIAVAGWGVLHLERWGRALVLVLDHAPALPSGALASLLEGAVEAAAAREVHGVALNGAPGAPARVLIASEKTAEHARKWLVEGATEAELLGRLHDAAAKAGGAA